MTTTRPYSRDTVTVVYLGYPIHIRENWLTICTPEGRTLLAGRIGMATARKMIRLHRREWTR